MRDSERKESKINGLHKTFPMSRRKDAQASDKEEK